MLKFRQLFIWDIFNRLVSQHFKTNVDLKYIVTHVPSFRHFSRWGLSRIVKSFGLPANQAHNAGRDAEMTLRLFFQVGSILPNYQEYFGKLWSLHYEPPVAVHWQKQFSISLKIIILISSKTFKYKHKE